MLRSWFFERYGSSKVSVPYRPIREVAVIGAGVAGLGAALVFGRLGYRVTVLERSSEIPSSIDRGDVLHLNALRALKSIGFDLGPLLDDARDLRWFEILAADGSVILRSPIAAVTMKHADLVQRLATDVAALGDAVTMCPQWRVQQVRYERASGEVRLVGPAGEFGTLVGESAGYADRTCTRACSTSPIADRR